MSVASAGLNGVFDARWAGKDIFTVPEAAEILRISRWSAYEAAKRGELGVVRIGRRCLVPRRVLERLLEGASA